MARTKLMRQMKIRDRSECKPMPPLTAKGFYHDFRSTIRAIDCLLTSVTADNLGQLVSTYSQVDALDFFRCTQSDPYMETLLGYLKSSNVARLSFTQCDLSVQKIQAIVTTLRDCGSKSPDETYRSCPCPHGCRSLYNAAIDIGVTEPRRFFCEVFAHSEKAPHSVYTCTRVLTDLVLCNNHLGDAGCIAIADVLPSTKLTHLELSENQIGDAGCAELARVLPSTCITHFDLSGNAIGKDGIRALCEALETRPKLETLSLRDNQLDDSSILVLAKSLPLSKLKNLYLSSNSFTDVGFVALGQAIRLSTTIRELSVNHIHGITDHGVRQFCDLVGTHVCFRSIVLDDERISMELRRDIYLRLKALYSKKAKVFVALCTTKYVKRLGVKSKLEMLPVDLIRRLKEYVA